MAAAPISNMFNSIGDGLTKVADFVVGKLGMGGSQHTPKDP